MKLREMDKTRVDIKTYHYPARNSMERVYEEVKYNIKPATSLYDTSFKSREPLNWSPHYENSYIKVEKNSENRTHKTETYKYRVNSLANVNWPPHYHAPYQSEETVKTTETTFKVEKEHTHQRPVTNISSDMGVFFNGDNFAILG